MTEKFTFLKHTYIVACVPNRHRPVKTKLKHIRSKQHRNMAAPILTKAHGNFSRVGSGGYEYVNPYVARAQNKTERIAAKTTTII